MKTIKYFSLLLILSSCSHIDLDPVQEEEKYHPIEANKEDIKNLRRIYCE